MQEILQTVIHHAASGKMDKSLAVKLIKFMKNYERQPEREPIAIIGMDGIFPNAANLDEFWNNLSEGRDCVMQCPSTRRRDTDDLLNYVVQDQKQFQYKKGAYVEEIDKFDYGLFKISPKEAALMDPHQRLFLQCAWNAITKAGYGGKILVGSNTGVFVGHSSDFGEAYREIIERLEPSSLGLSISGNIKSFIASRISYILDLKGPSLMIDTACSSSLVALHLACQSMRNGEIDMALVGGAKLALLPLVNKAFEGIGIEAPDSCTKPFDDRANGTTLGEGIGVLLLKPLSKALKHKDHIHAVIKGSAINQDGTTNGITAPNSLAQRDVILKAWEDAHIEPETISYIEAHGTGTALGDPIEVDGIESAFGQYTHRKQFCAIGSVKSNIGHLDNASGIAGIIKAILCLEKKKIPPTLNFQKPNKKIEFKKSPIFVNDQLLDWKSDDTPLRCGVSSFGLSGTNCHVVLEEFIPSSQQVETVGGPYLFVLSAQTKEALNRLAICYKEWVECTKVTKLQNLCMTSNASVGNYRYRIAITSMNKSQLVQGLSDIAHRPDNPPTEGVYVGDAAGRRIDPSRVLNVVERLREQKRWEVSVLTELGELFVDGAEINWGQLYDERLGSKVPLPAYPYEQTRCWLDVPQTPPISGGEMLYHTTTWIPEEQIADQSSSTEHPLLIIDKKEGKGHLLSSIFQARGRDVELLEVELPRVTEAELETTLGRFRDKKVDIIYLLSDYLPIGLNNVQDIQKQLQSCITNLLLLYQVLNNIQCETRLLLVTRNGERVDGNEVSLSPESSALYALGKIAGYENLGIIFKCLDLDNDQGLNPIVEEIEHFGSEYIVAYRKKVRYVERFDAIDRQSMPSRPINIRDNGVYIVSGGAGGIGLEVCKYIASKENVRIAIINRSSLPDRSEWKSVADGLESDVSRRIKGIMEIEKNGSQVYYYRADVSDQEAIRNIVLELRGRFGRIDGVIHAAGLGTGESGTLLVHETEERIEAFLKPKVYGTWILDQETNQDDLDFFITFTSPIKLTGGVGAGAYTVANAYLDTFAYYRSMSGRNIYSIGWAPWQETVKKMGKDFKREKQLFNVLSTEQLLRGFDEVLDKRLTVSTVGSINYESDIFILDEALPFRLSQRLKNQVRHQKVANGNRTKRFKLIGEAKNYNMIGIAIAEIIGRILGYSELDTDVNMIEIGGDSIHAMRIVNTLREELGIPATVADLLKSATIHDFITGAYRTEIDHMGISQAGVRDHYPLSSAQKRMYFLSQLEHESINYNVQMLWIIKGQLDVKRLEEAFRRLVDRHEALRTTFDFLLDEPVQRIAAHQPFHLTVIDVGDREAIDSEIRSFIKPFDLHRSPLFRVALLKETDFRHVLVVDMHHIITDGVSITIMLEDLFKYYSGIEPSKLNIQYKDYAVWQTESMLGEGLNKEEEYWLGEFEDGVPMLNMPTDFTRPPIRGNQGDLVRFHIDGELVRRLSLLGQETGATVYMLLMAIFNILLSKYSGDEDIVIGSPVYGRPNVDTEQVVGMFVNTLPIRNQPKAGITVRDFIANVKTKCLSAYANHNYQFEELVGKLHLPRDLSRNPVFDVAFVQQSVGSKPIHSEGLSFERLAYETFHAKFDLTLITEPAEERIDLFLEYNSKIYKNEAVQRLADHFVGLLKSAVENPDQKIGELEMLTAAEQELILHSFNPAKTDYPNHLTVNEIFEEQVLRTPNNVATRCGGETRSYLELNEMANLISVNLREKGVKPGRYVAIMAERSIEMIAGILGILKSGAAYVPIDPSFPEERISYMLKDSGVCILLTQIIREEIDYSGEQMLLNEAILNNSGNTSLERLHGPQDPAYLIYTSGSTGKPKGVIVEHSSVINRLHWMQKEYPLHESDVLMQKTSITFDVSVWELFWWAFNGASVYLLAPGGEKDPKYMVEVIDKEKVTIMHFVPSMLGIFLKILKDEPLKIDRLSSLRHVFASGEALQPVHVQQFMKLLGDTHGTNLTNLYGPTETTVDVTYYDCTNDSVELVPIGRPISNTQAYIIDRLGKLQPIGVHGELYISGHGLARGYLNRVELTDERFVLNPYRLGERMYRTGDLAKWLPDGNIAFLGRIDNQVKIRGHRIELGEIENRIAQYELVEKCAVLAIRDQDGMDALCAYVVSNQQLTVSTLRAYLALHLPHYMIPQHYKSVKDLPLNANGKVSKELLLGMGQQLPPNTYDTVKPIMDLEREIISIWSEALKVNQEQISVNDNFFDLGGNSLSIMKVHAAIENKGVGNVSIMDLFSNPTVADLARVIRNRKDETTKQSVSKPEELELMFKDLMDGTMTIDEAAAKLSGRSGSS